MNDAIPVDRHLWLEDITGERSLDWVRERNAESAKVLETPECTELKERILRILDSDARIPAVEKRGSWWYNLWQDHDNPRGLWRRTTFDEYRKPQPAWETVLDIDRLGEDENENWVLQGVDFLKPEYERCLVHLSRGGADASVMREFDVGTLSFVADGFTLPEAKCNVCWKDGEALYVGTDFGPGSMTTSGYPRVAKIWKRGTPLADAETIFEGNNDDVYVVAIHDDTSGFERDFIIRGITFYTNEMFLRRHGALIRIDKPDSAIVSVHRDLLLLELREDWKEGDATYPAGALLACDFDAFIGGERRFDLLFTPTERTSLAGTSATHSAILVNELDNVRSRVYVHTRDGGAWRREPLPGVPQFGTVTATAVDESESDDYFLTATDYLTPTRLYFGSIGRGAPELLKELPPLFDATGLTVTQHEVASRDGTRIPYFQIAPKDLEHEGNNPTILYGYGGFEIPLVPAYSGSIGAAWLEAGGVYVVANLRGGGEFGPRWHQAALKENRHRAYEDCIAVAEDLVKRRITSPAHLGISGGSNGGLLVGNMLTARPDLFGAAVARVPVLDMRRYHVMLAGASWVGEFGNPDDPDDWAFIRTFSPYHNLRDGVRYPPVLYMTSTRDDRVHPGHARKMAARMLDAGHDVLYYENIEGGHGGAADNRQRAHMQALEYTFLWQRLRRT